MGVRFPVQPPRPDFGQMQQTPNLPESPAQADLQSATRAETRQTQAAEQQTAIRETQNDQQVPPREASAERAADSAGTQTPGTLIDILA